MSEELIADLTLKLIPSITDEIEIQETGSGDSFKGTLDSLPYGAIIEAAVQQGKSNWIDGGGTADVITATYSPALTSLVDGQLCFVRAAAANATATPTFSPNGLTPHTIVNIGGSALIAGNIAGDSHELILRYNLVNTRWELLNPAQQTALDLKENSLGNPTVDGHVLSSTIAGVRSWTAGGGALDMPVVAHAVAYTALPADKGKALNCINTWTLGLTAAATLGDGWTLVVNNSGTGTITLGTIGGTVEPNDSVLIGCDGTNFFLISDKRPNQYCTAWVNFDGTTGAIRDSFNVSSVIRTAVGTYTITFTVAMTNANYSINSSSSYSTTSTNMLQIDNTIAQTVTTFHVINVGTSFTDPSVANVSIFGGK